jgi:hypothetical protein
VESLVAAAPLDSLLFDETNFIEILCTERQLCIWVLNGLVPCVGSQRFVYCSAGAFLGAFLLVA